MNQQETEQAQVITARMAQPLDVSELRACELLGMDPETYLTQRNEDLAKQLPGGQFGLDAEERKVCQALGMSEEAFAAEKKHQVRR